MTHLLAGIIGRIIGTFFALWVQTRREQAAAKLSDKNTIHYWVEEREKPE